MRNFSIDIIWAKIQIAFTAIGGWLGYFLGGMDGLLIALLVLMVLDYMKKAAKRINTFSKMQHEDLGYMRIGSESTT